MNVQCTHCNTVFRVDPAKVPAGGARARCSICRGVFEVAPRRRAPLPRRSPPPLRLLPEPEPRTSIAAPAALRPRSRRRRPPRPRRRPLPPRRPPGPAQRTAPAAPGGARRSARRTRSAKARRLARALVSDIVTYHPERRDRAVEEGTLKREFMEEIKKSWEEYVAQVGPETARSTPHFRDALNEILARGQSVF
jgi:predicted Zn finger-like uncharacterized protein